MEEMLEGKRSDARCKCGTKSKREIKHTGWKIVSIIKAMV